MAVGQRRDSAAAIGIDGLREELLGDGAAPLASALYGKVRLFGVMAAGSLALELGAPAVLADKRLSRLWALGAFSMHWGIYLTMKIKFRYQMSGLVFASFFELERILGWLAGRVGREPLSNTPPCGVTVVFGGS